MKTSEARALFPQIEHEPIQSTLRPTAPVNETTPSDDGAVFHIDADVKYAEARRLAILEFERLYLRALLEKAKGNVSRAAREAGIDRVYLHRLIRRHGTKAELASRQLFSAR